MKAHLDVDSESSFVQTVAITAARQVDIKAVDALSHGEEEAVYADAGYTGADKGGMRKRLKWQVVAKR